MRLVIVVEFYFNALSEIWEVMLQHLPIPLSERHRLQLRGGSMDPEMPLVEAEVESADYGPLTKSQSVELVVVPLKADVINTILDKQHFLARLQTLNDYFLRSEKPGLQTKE